MMLRRLLALSSALAFATTTPLTAQTQGVTFTVTPQTFTSALNESRGWQFTLLQNVFVTSVGVFDAGADGLNRTRSVGIWSTAGVAPLTSVVAPAGVGGTLGTDNFRYFSLAMPFFLGVGTYNIGADYIVDDTDAIAFETAPTGAAGFVVYNGPRLSSVGGFANPTSVSAVKGGAFGPNFQFSAAGATVVPEPSVAVLFAAGLFALGIAARRRTLIRKCQQLA